MHRIEKQTQEYTKMPEEAVHVDQYFIDGILAHDREVLNELYQLYLPRVAQVVTRNQGSEEDALDIFQEAIIIIYKKAESDGLVIKQSFYNYLYTICKNLWMRELDRQKKGKTMASTLALDEEDGFDPGFDIGLAARERGLHRLYVEKFQQLGEGCQKVLRYFFDGHTMQHIASVMGFKSEGYAKKRKHQCQKKLIDSIQSDNRFKQLL